MTDFNNLEELLARPAYTKRPDIAKLECLAVLEGGRRMTFQEAVELSMTLRKSIHWPTVKTRAEQRKSPQP